MNPLTPIFQTVIFIQTVKDFYAFDVSFQLPDLREHYETKPASFLAHFFGHEGPGSICAYLKKKGWLTSLSSGPSGSSRSVQFFAVHGRLTLEGYRKYILCTSRYLDRSRSHCAVHYREVLEAVFNYISLLRASPLPVFHFAEVRTMAATRFRFKEKAQPHSYATALAHALAEPYPPEQLLSGAHFYRDWDESLVRQVLDGFVPERVRVTLQAKTHHEDIVRNDVEWVTEKWYGTQYVVQKMEQELLQKVSNLCARRSCAARPRHAARPAQHQSRAVSSYAQPLHT